MKLRTPDQSAKAKGRTVFVPFLQRHYENKKGGGLIPMSKKKGEEGRTLPSFGIKVKFLGH